MEIEGEGMGLTDDSVIGSRNGVFGDGHEDASVGQVETLGKRVG